MAECAAVHDRTFEDIRGRLRREVDEIWRFERPEYGPNRPVIVKPTVSGLFAE